MNSKLSVSLVLPLLVIAAFAATPVVAQAETKTMVSSGESSLCVNPAGFSPGVYEKPNYAPLYTAHSGPFPDTGAACAEGSPAHAVPRTGPGHPGQEGGPGNPVWPYTGKIPGASWVSVSSGGEDFSNSPPRYYIYDATVELCSDQIEGATIQGTMLADDTAGAFLNGVPLAHQPFPNTDANQDGTPTPFSYGPNPSTFKVGVNVLQFVVLDEFAGLSGVDFSATVTTSRTCSEKAEYGQCEAQKKGNYTEANCQTVAEKKGKPDHKGKFEWRPGPSPTCVPQKKGEYTTDSCSEKSAKPHKGKFEKEPGSGYTSTTGEATLEVPAAGYSGACAASTGSGEITGTKTGVETDTFTGCETNGHKCTSAGDPPGTVTTFPMETILIEPSSGVAWIKYVGKPEYSGYLRTYECEGLGAYGTRGWVSGVQAGNVNVSSSTSTTTFASGLGEQELITEGTGIGEDLSIWTTVAHKTSAEKTEIKT